VESNWIHSARRPPIGLFYMPRAIMRMENLIERWLAGETEVLGENLRQYHSVHQIPHNLTGRELGPAINRLSYGTTEISEALGALQDTSARH
jgi:hypothetical protein